MPGRSQRTEGAPVDLPGRGHVHLVPDVAHRGAQRHGCRTPRSSRSPGDVAGRVRRPRYVASRQRSASNGSSERSSSSHARLPVVRVVTSTSTASRAVSTACTVPDHVPEPRAEGRGEPGRAAGEGDGGAGRVEHPAADG